MYGASAISPTTVHRHPSEKQTPRRFVLMQLLCGCNSVAICWFSNYYTAVVVFLICFFFFPTLCPLVVWNNSSGWDLSKTEHFQVVVEQLKPTEFMRSTNRSFFGDLIGLVRFRFWFGTQRLDIGRPTAATKHGIKVKCAEIKPSKLQKRQ